MSKPSRRRVRKVRRHMRPVSGPNRTGYYPLPKGSGCAIALLVGAAATITAAAGAVAAVT